MIGEEKSFIKFFTRIFGGTTLKRISRSLDTVAAIFNYFYQINEIESINA
jgi:hypothetical protein